MPGVLLSRGLQRVGHDLVTGEQVFHNLDVSDSKHPSLSEHLDF